MKKLLLFIFLLPWPVYSELNYTAYELLEACEDIRHAACVQYIKGVTNTMKAIDKPLCYPANIDSDVLNQSIIKFIEQNPKVYHLNASQVVIFAFNRIYPCK